MQKPSSFFTPVSQHPLKASHHGHPPPSQQPLPIATASNPSPETTPSTTCPDFNSQLTPPSATSSPSTTNPQLPAQQKPSIPFARPRPSRPAPAQPSTPSPMAATYWSRLSALLREATALATSLIPLPDLSTDKAAKGASGIVAVDLQGLKPQSVQDKLLRKAGQEDDWKRAYEAGGIGNFEAYGVPSASAHWVALKLSQTCSDDGWKPPSSDVEPDLSDATTAQDPVVESVRVRVWESEPAHLPIAMSERLVGFRRRLRRYRGRAELCIKILSALEGRGRKITVTALEKAKFALEKADAIHVKEELRIRERKDKEKKAAETARAKMEKKLEKTRRIKEQKVKKSIDRKKKKESSAQAMFMKRFVKPKSSSSLKDKDVEVVVLDETASDSEKIRSAQENSDSSERERPRAVPTYSDKDAMTTSWWLQTEMDAPDFEDMDQKLRYSNKLSTAVQASPDGALRQHIYSCAERRKTAEARIHKVLRDYRRQRITHVDDRMPRFTQRRSDVRGRGKTGPIKLLQFEEDYRPAFFGTDSRRSKMVGPRRPLGKDIDLDYSCDSGEEWGEDDDAEDLLDIEADKERADEDDELRKLYGSDEEDDDDFLDDKDADEEEEDDSSSNDEGENGEDYSGVRGDGAISVSAGATPGSANIIGSSPSAITDLNVTTTATGTKRVRSPKSDGTRDRTKMKRRRRNKFKQSVVIQGVSLPGVAGESPLDCYAVTMLDGAPRILMFNPYITHVTDFLQETSPPKPAPIRIPRTSLDDGAKHDLATVIVTGTSKTSRDNIVFEFCERRRRQGLPVPPKVEVVRAIRVIATNEKRKGDSRAAWYLKDQLLASKIRALSTADPNRKAAMPAASGEKMTTPKDANCLAPYSSPSTKGVQESPASGEQTTSVLPEPSDPVHEQLPIASCVRQNSETVPTHPPNTT